MTDTNWFPLSGPHKDCRVIRAIAALRGDWRAAIDGDGRWHVRFPVGMRRADAEATFQEAYAEAVCPEDPDDEGAERRG